jgi:mono/diheme cytochrome c family protein
MRWRWFLAGTIAFPLMAGAVTWMVLKTRANGWSARMPPTRFEAFLAAEARSLSMPAAAVRRTNPVSDSPVVLAEARAHWADHCAICHSNDGSGDAPMGKGMFPPAPDMRQPPTQRMTDGELFYVIENGIRLTGMPAWGGAGDHEQDSWKLVRFIRHLPQLTAQELHEMEALNPKSPEELKEEQEEKEFLNGGQPHEHTTHQHL